MTEQPGPSKGVAFTNWLVNKTAGLLEKKSSRRGFLLGSAMVGSAVAVAGCAPGTQPGSPYNHITDCGGGLCTDGFTEFCCTINNGLNTCPSGSFPGGWWRADFSSFCNGTRYYIDCMQNCCGPDLGNGFCAGCVECTCAGDCSTRRIYCNYFRYGQCHQEIGISGPIACRVVTCTPPYEDASLACSTALAVDNSTAEHAPAHGCTPPPPPPPPLFLSAAVLPRTAAAVANPGGSVSVFARRSDGGVFFREHNTAWGPEGGLSPTMTSALTAVSDATGLWVFGRGSDKGIWFQRRAGSAWSGWLSLGPTAVSDPAAVSHSSGLYVFVRGADDAVWFRRSVGAGAFSDWASLGGIATSDPAVVADPTGLFVFVRGNDLDLWYQRFRNGSWSPGWQKMDGLFTSDPAVVSDPSGLYVFALGRDHAVWFRRGVNDSWGPWTSLGGTGTSDPAVTSAPSGVWVFVRGTDNGIWAKRFISGVWDAGWRTLGPTSTTTPTAVTGSDGAYVFVCGADNTLWYQRFDGDHFTGWQSLGGNLAPQHAGQ
jgi:hypothetical protein